MQGVYGTVLEFHDKYRLYRAKGFSKGEALSSAKMHHFEAYKAYVDAQNRGERLDSLDAKDASKINLIRVTGKLEQL